MDWAYFFSKKLVGGSGGKIFISGDLVEGTGREMVGGNLWELILKLKRREFGGVIILNLNRKNWWKGYGLGQFIF